VHAIRNGEERKTKCEMDEENPLFNGRGRSGSAVDGYRRMGIGN
jgi:hypothetical protein